jgi:hypothetical protein
VAKAAVSIAWATGETEGDAVGCSTGAGSAIVGAGIGCSACAGGAGDWDWAATSVEVSEQALKARRNGKIADRARDMKTPSSGNNPHVQAL